jgi:hypothetical protein
MAVSKRITGDGAARVTWLLRLSEYPERLVPFQNPPREVCSRFTSLPTEDRGLPSLMYGNSRPDVASPWSQLPATRLTPVSQGTRAPAASRRHLRSPGHLRRPGS